MRFFYKAARGASLGASVLVCGLLASCGGSTQVERFVPTRVIALGDETSVLNANGTRYGINAVVSATDPTLECRSNPIWVQVLASAYGFVFAQCNPTAAAVAAVTLAVPGAKVADIAAQAAQVGALTGFELVTVLAGANDILAQYARYPGVSEQQLSAELEGAGAALAAQVNVLANAGGKVLIATVPDLGLSPFAIAQKAANTDTDRAALLTRLTARLNAKLRANIINDGRRIGLLLADELIQTDVKFPSTYGYVNVTEAACLSTAVLPACTTATLQPANGTVLAAGSFSWLWADATHLSPGGHNQLGALAASRAAGNPF
jgi:outer membrane lipase/esterase